MDEYGRERGLRYEGWGLCQSLHGESHARVDGRVCVYFRTSSGLLLHLYQRSDVIESATRETGRDIAKSVFLAHPIR